MKSYPFSIVTPQGQGFKGEVESLVAPGLLGKFGILPNHTPMVSMLKNGALKIVSSGQESFFAVTSGLLEVNQEGEVLILVDSAVPAQSLEEAQEKCISLA